MAVEMSGIARALVELDEEEVSRLVDDALAEGVPASEILDGGLMAGMDIVGEHMSRDAMFIPEVLRAAKIMRASVERLSPLLTNHEASTRGTVLIGTVQGDCHDIGKNLVVMMMESSGFRVIDLGVDVSNSSFVDAIKKIDPDILGLSALLTSTAETMRETIAFIAEKGLREQLKILVGGASITGAFAEDIGADGYAPDAASAVVMAKRLLEST